MQVRVKMMGLLKPKTPEGGKLELPEDAGLGDALQRLDIPPGIEPIVIVNGKAETDRGRKLVEGDELLIMPPVGGG